MFNDKHKSVQDSNQILLYDITVGNLTTYYTSSELPRIVGGNTYIPYPGLDSTEVNNTGDEQKNQVKVSLDILEPIAVYLLRYIPTSEITVKITTIEREDIDGEIIHEWSGIYIGYEANAPKFSLIFAPFDRELARDALSASFGIDCQWTQYDLNCGLNPLAFTVVGTITSINNLSIETDLTLNTPSADHYLGGYIEMDGVYGFERAWIIGQIGANTIEVDRELQAFEIGAAVRVLPSCRGSFNRCSTLFNNRLRFMGAPHANKLNPFTSDVRGNV